jgi:hypothetical protein
MIVIGAGPAGEKAAAQARGVPEVSSSRGPLVLIDQSFQNITAAQLAKGRSTIRWPHADDTGAAWPKLRCGRRRL